MQSSASFTLKHLPAWMKTTLTSVKGFFSWQHTVESSWNLWKHPPHTTRQWHGMSKLRVHLLLSTPQQLFPLFTLQWPFSEWKNDRYSQDQPFHVTSVINQFCRVIIWSRVGKKITTVTLVILMMEDLGLMSCDMRFAIRHLRVATIARTV